MSLLLISFAASLVSTLLIVGSNKLHAKYSGDHEQSGPQKFHGRAVPRIGGIGVMVGVIAGMGLLLGETGMDARTSVILLGAGSIAFCGGLVEDFTKRVTPRQRMLFMIMAAALALWLIDAEIVRTDIAGLDPLIQNVAGASALLTLFAVAGVANSVNIIDGFNGLASMCVAIMLGALTLVAHAVGDHTIMHLALVGLGAVLGFFVLNYPFGKIFLGDGGAYFMGFWVAELSILLVQRNDSVSPMFPLLLCIYPIFETVFSMYRRKIIRRMPVGQPDAVHLHSLIYRRLMRWAIGKRDAATLLRRNSMTSPYLWALCSLAAVPAVIWWNNSVVLQLCILAFCFIYWGLYRAIVTFRTPRVLIQRSDAEPALDSAG